LEKEEVRIKLEEMSDEFIRDYCYKIDGLSSKRAAEVIISMTYSPH